ncbi:hypothetical protein TNCV_82001 [Trichonephila clavipes]|nr:hypothetical protein TNCV_82001 [Trichonephila clavipes]
MANIPSSRKIFCSSVPLTTIRPPRPLWLNLPLKQEDRYSTGTLYGGCTRRRSSCSWLLDRNSLGVEVTRHDSP